MHVLFMCRPTIFAVPGGDTVQIQLTAAELRKLGVTVTLHHSSVAPDYTPYDLLHFFNIIDCEDLLGPAMNSGKPYVISTIYLNYREYDRLHRKGAIGMLSSMLPYDSVEYLKTLAKRVLKGERVSTGRYWLKGHAGSVRYLLRNTRCILPNSENEHQRVLQDYGIDAPCQVVPNGFDPGLFPLNEPETTNRSGVICVGRIEGRKNQLTLIRALNDTGIPLLLNGRMAPNQQRYYDQCKAEAGPNVTFINHQPMEQLVHSYRSRKVHVLPSWFETTGLSTLEAAAAGCNIVVGDRGDVRDYFGNYAYYCEPGSVESVREAVLKALEATPDPALKAHVHKNYTWRKAAEATLEAYRSVLNDNDSI